MTPEQNPEDRNVQVDNEELVLDVTLVCETVDPETVFAPLLVNRSTAKMSGVTLPKTRLLLATWYPS